MKEKMKGIPVLAKNRKGKRRIVVIGAVREEWEGMIVNLVRLVWVHIFFWGDIIMGEPLSPDRVFDFSMDEQGPHPAYDFFAPGPLPGYAGNPNNANEWIEADVPLSGEMGGLGGKRGVVDGSCHTTSDPSCTPTEHLRGRRFIYFCCWGTIFYPPATGFPVPPPVIKDLCTRMGNLEYGHGQLVKKVIQVSDTEVVDGIAIREIGPRVSAVEGHIQVMASQMVHAVGRLEQAAVQHRDVQIQQLQALVSEMSSRESTLMQCIIGMDRCLADLERRPPRSQ
ncbi:hypothetical protein Tco_0316328 [Tanacetum coccineum]